MSDVFLSYANEDRDRVRLLAAALETTGWSVFWDRKIPAGLNWRELINAELSEARCVIVGWSAESVKSDWVLEEAEFGKKKRILIPVLFEELKPPFGFGSLQASDLSAWDGDAGEPVFQQLVKDMGRILAPPPRRLEKAKLRQPEEETARQRQAFNETEGAEPEIDQAASVCYRRKGESLEFLLIRTDGGRWIFPKGGIGRGEAAWMAAEREALEEAGVSGDIRRQPLAQFIHLKRGLKRRGKELVVGAFLLRVTDENGTPEEGRTPTWFSPQEARLRLSEDREPAYRQAIIRVLDTACEKLG